MGPKDVDIVSLAFSSSLALALSFEVCNDHWTHFQSIQPQTYLTLETHSLRAEVFLGVRISVRPPSIFY